MRDSDSLILAVLLDKVVLRQEFGYYLHLKVRNMCAVNYLVYVMPVAIFE